MGSSSWMPVVLFLCALTPQAAAMVGNAPPATSDTGAAHAVLLVGSRGTACTGAAIARDLVLTAAHCVQPGADYKLVEFDAARRPTLKDIKQITAHPQFAVKALLAHRATADVALLKLPEPLPASIAPARISPDPAPNKPGETFVVAGYGLAVREDLRSGGTLRSASLVATGRPGNLQLRLVDPATRGERTGQGACTGDSGAPVFRASGSQLALIGVVSWSTGPKNSAGCGGLTGVTPLALYRDWIFETARKLGSPLSTP